MKIKITDTTIEFGINVPQRPTQRDADLIMRELSRVLGEGFGAVKISGYWTIGRFDHTALDRGENARWEPIFGHRPGQSRKSFDRALSDGLSRTVVRTVEFEDGV